MQGWIINTETTWGASFACQQKAHLRQRNQEETHAFWPNHGVRLPVW